MEALIRDTDAETTGYEGEQLSGGWRTARCLLVFLSSARILYPCSDTIFCKTKIGFDGWSYMLYPNIYLVFFSLPIMDYQFALIADKEFFFEDIFTKKN